MAAPLPPSLAPPGSSSGGGPAVGVSMPMFHGAAFLGEVEVFPMIEGGLPFPRNEIRVSYLSPAGGERCPPLAILQIIAPFSVRCKLQAKTMPPHSNLCRLYSTCFKERKSAVVAVGDEELHLVAMPSKVMKVPCFWCFSVRSGLYAASLEMLNQYRLAIVFDLDDTLVVANTMKSFEERIEVLSNRMEAEEDPGRLARMTAEIKRYIEDKEVLKEFIYTDAVTHNGRIIGSKEELVPVADGQERVVRRVIRLPERSAILTRINPEIRDTSVFVKLRPAWEELRSYLSVEGRKRFEVYVCTMSERDYALEMWRLLDPGGSLINLQQLSQRVVCVKPGFKKSLEDVFQHRGCHPKMAIVIDDRLEVWEDKDQPRVHVVPAYTPYYAPQAEMTNAGPVLCVTRNVASSVRGGFFRKFDEVFLKKVYEELFYENELLDLPDAPDARDYLVCEDTNLVASNKDHASIPEGMRGAEVEKRLKGQSYLLGEQREGEQVPASTGASDNDGMAIRGTGGFGDAAQSSGGSQAIAPSQFVTALEEIARLCGAKVEFIYTPSNGKNMRFSFEVLFNNEKIGSGIGRTREEAKARAAEEGLRDLEGSFLAFVSRTAGALKKDTAMQEPSGSTLQQDQSNNFDKLSSVMSLIREHCLEDQLVVFKDQVQISSSTGNEEYHSQVELAGQIVGRGLDSERDVAKLLAAQEALRTLESTTDPQIKKYLRPARCAN